MLKKWLANLNTADVRATMAKKKKRDRKRKRKKPSLFVINNAKKFPPTKRVQTQISKTLH